MDIGVQLYAFPRPQVLAHLEPILDHLAASGYRAIEGLPKHDVVYRQELDSRGLRYAATHCNLKRLEELPALIDYLGQMGGADICSSAPLNGRQAGPDDYRRTAEYLNEQGRTLRDAGIWLHYHNHEFEFVPLEGDGRTGMEILLEGIDTSAVDLCFDAGWPWQEGTDPAAFLREQAAAIRYVHLRDFQGEDWAPLGRGELDLPAIIEAALALPELRWLVVEHDPSDDDPGRDLAISRDYLREQAAL